MISGPSLVGVIVTLFLLRGVLAVPTTKPIDPDPLRTHVEKLARTIGPRAYDDATAIRKTLDYLESKLKDAGYVPVRHDYRIGDIVATNLVAELKGTGDEVVIVGAHYDSVPTTPGADDNASGVAGTLELARRLKDARPARTIRFAFFACEEPPNFQRDSMGSLVYARQCRDRGEKVVAMLALEMLGYYSDAPNSQHFPQMLAARYPTTGNYLAVVGNVKNKALVERVKTTFAKATDLLIEAAALPDVIVGVTFSDHWSFWQADYPAVMFTDTAMFRNPHYHRETDTPDTIDYARLAKAIDGVEGVVKSLAE